MNPVTSSNAHDLALWKAFRNGDREAFSTLYQTYAGVLFRYGLRLVENQDWIRDAIQDLFIELWQSRTRLSETSSVRYYLLGAMRHKLARHLQKQPQHTPLEDLPLHTWIMPSPEQVWLEAEQAAQEQAKLQALIAALPARQREALHLRYYQGLSNQQIAELMGVHYQSASNLIHRALAFLRENLTLLGFSLWFWWFWQSLQKEG